MEFGATEDYCCNDLKLAIDRLLCQMQLIVVHTSYGVLQKPV